METEKTPVSTPARTPAPAATPASASSASASPVTNTVSSGGPNRTWVYVTVVVLITVVILGGLLYLRNSQVKKQVKNTTVVGVFDDLKKDLQQTDIGASEDDIKQLDQDIQSL